VFFLVFLFNSVNVFAAFFTGNSAAVISSTRSTHSSSFTATTSVTNNHNIHPRRRRILLRGNDKIPGSNLQHDQQQRQAHRHLVLLQMNWWTGEQGELQQNMRDEQERQAAILADLRAREQAEIVAIEKQRRETWSIVGSLREKTTNFTRTSLGVGALEERRLAEIKDNADYELKRNKKVWFESADKMKKRLVIEDEKRRISKLHPVAKAWADTVKSVTAQLQDIEAVLEGRETAKEKKNRLQKELEASDPFFAMKKRYYDATKPIQPPAPPGTLYENITRVFDEVIHAEIEPSVDVNVIKGAASIGGLFGLLACQDVALAGVSAASLAYFAVQSGTVGESTRYISQVAVNSTKIATDLFVEYKLNDQLESGRESLTRIASNAVGIGREKIGVLNDEQKRALAKREEGGRLVSEEEERVRKIDEEQRFEQAAAIQRDREVAERERLASAEEARRLNDTMNKVKAAREIAERERGALERAAAEVNAAANAVQSDAEAKERFEKEKLELQQQLADGRERVRNYEIMKEEEEVGGDFAVEEGRGKGEEAVTTATIKVDDSSAADGNRYQAAERIRIPIIARKSETIDQLRAQSIAQLTMMLKDRGLISKGTKSQLVQRLIDDNDGRWSMID
jgi:hypothetical protein